MDDEARTPTALAWLLVVAFLAAAGWSAKGSHPTFEEPVHATMGLHGLGELVEHLRIPPGVSPLEVYLALPLYFTGDRAPDINQVLVSGPPQARWNDSVVRMSSGTQGLFVRMRYARVMVLILAVIGAWMVRRLASGFGGETLGIVAMLLLFCWPPFFAHGQLATTDAGQAVLAAMVLLACREFTEPGTTPAVPWVRSGLVLGIALWAGPVGTALWLFLGAVTVAVAVSGFLSRRSAPPEPVEKEASLRDFLNTGRMHRIPRRRQRRTGSVVTRFLILSVMALLLVNALGRFEGTGQRLVERGTWSALEPGIERLPAAIRGPVRWGAELLPMPLPESVVAQWSRALEPSADGGLNYFHGRVREQPMPWQGPLVLLLKTPIALALLVGLGFLCVLWRRRWMAAGTLSWLVGWPAFYCVLGALGLVPAESRAWLPVLPSLAVLGGIGFLMGARVGAGVGGMLCSVPAWVLLLATVLTHVRVYPFEHAFVMEAVADLDDSRLWFARSDGDWGQDLGRVGQLLRRRGMAEVAIGHYGAGRAGLPMAGDPLPSLGPAAPPGVIIGDGPLLPTPLPNFPLVVSASLLQGAVMPGAYASLRGRPPDEMLTPTFALFLPPHP